MDFYSWMLQKYKGKDTPKGDFAEDMENDRNFPRNVGRERLLEYLEWNAACEECIAVFIECWSEYDEAVGNERAGN